MTVSPAPGPFVKEMNDAGQFYTNRVLKDWRDKSKAHVEWTKAWIQTLSEMQKFVKEFHTTGLVWNAKGVEAKSLVNHGKSFLLCVCLQFQFSFFQKLNVPVKCSKICHSSSIQKPM